VAVRAVSETINVRCEKQKSAKLNDHMFLQLSHKSLNVYEAARELAMEVYKVSKLLPVEEKFNMLPQMRRAALSVKLNLAEGSSRKSETERKRFYEISRGSVVEIDAVLETAVDVGFLKKEELNIVGDKLNKCFAMLSNMLN
jgi:four helix bundle protein